MHRPTTPWMSDAMLNPEYYSHNTSAAVAKQPSLREVFTAVLSDNWSEVTYLLSFKKKI